ncbi:MAG: glycosyl transferase, group 1 [Verrucomicrobiales bacterium]|nr:glycosyl transferase, group 1 [Verrucomicrobiales bacterium]
MNRQNQKSSICIVCHKAYGALSGGFSGHVGGIERQLSILARWLVDQGHEVSVLTWDEGGDPIEWINGVRVIKICRQKAGLPGLRFVHPKWTGLVRAMRLADADVYYQSGAECVTGQVAMWCKSNKRKFIFSTACDSNCSAALPALHTWRERFLYRYGLRNADHIVTQTEKQRKDLMRNLGAESGVIRYACPKPSGSTRPRDLAYENKRILWLARVCRQKRPDRLLELAVLCPEFIFDLVGPVYPDAYSQDVIARAKKLKNVIVHGSASREMVSAYYEKAFCLCCTSDNEGFPNTFLEAWSNGLPVVSTFDPDSLIAKRELGFSVENVEQMASMLHHLADSKDLYCEISSRARDYFLAHHTPEVVLPQYEEVFRSVSVDQGRLGNHAAGRKEFV